MKQRAMLLGVLGLVWLCGSAGAEVPLGHEDFLPTPDRPIGWRGDGNGAFPGATPPEVFLEGKLVEEEILVRDSKGRRPPRKQERFFLKPGEGKNVLWKTPMPSWTNSTPIVVGDRVFTMAEPHTLVCCDAKTGKILWQADNNPFETLPITKEEAEELYTLCEIARASQVLSKWLHIDTRGKGGQEKLKKAVDAEWQARYDAAEKALRRAREVAVKIVPEMSDQFDDALKTIEQRRKGGGSKSFNIGWGKLHEKYKLRTYDAWMGMIGWTFATPCSDGKRVYITCGQGQAAAYSLDGKRLWMRFLPISGKASNRSRAQHVPSPVLIDGVLIAQGVDRLYGLDAETGKTLWEAGSAVGGGYRCGTGKALRIGDKPVFVTTGGEVFHARTGDLLVKLPAAMCGSEAGGASVVGTADRVYFRTGSNTGGPMICFRLKPDGEKLSYEKVWTDPKSRNGNPTDIVHEGKIYQLRDGVMVRDAMTGKILVKNRVRVGDENRFGGKNSSIIAGDFFLGVCDTQAYRRVWPGDSLYATFGMAPLKQVNAGNAKWKLSMLGSENMKPHVPFMEKYVKKLYDESKYGHYFIPAHFGFGHPWPHGNRIYIRSMSHLYCVGRE